MSREHKDYKGKNNERYPPPEKYIFGFHLVAQIYEVEKDLNKAKSQLGN